MNPVILLLSSLTDQIPVRGSHLDETAGFNHQPRPIPCPDCALNGFRSPDCATCRGRGEIVEAVDADPYDSGITFSWGGIQAEHAKENRRRLDGELRDLPDHAALPALVRAIDQSGGEGEALEDSLLRCIRHRGRGDYRYLEQALDELQSWAKLLVFTVYVGAIPELAERRKADLPNGDRDKLDRTITFLGGRVTAFIRGENLHRAELGLPLRSEEISVPAHVKAAEREREEAEKLAKRAKKGPKADMRGLRNTRIRQLVGEGVAVSKVARQFGLSKRQVYNIIERREAA